MERRFLAWVAASAVFMAGVLLLDRDGLVPQVALGCFTAIFLAFFVRSMRLESRPILWCIAVATTGEVVLSLGWGLYTYGHALIPLYVPPGHGLFFGLAMATSRQELLRRHESSITRTVFVTGTLLAVWSLTLRHDVWGLLWWLGALALVRASRNQLMLAACFTYTIVLEYAGTAIGNWQWAAEVPFLGLHSANPPAGVGILYILLDLIVMGVALPSSAASLVASRRRRRDGAVPAGEDAGATTYAPVSSILEIRSRNSCAGTGGLIR